MNKLPLLLKREYWEHRGGFLWTPIWTTASILLISLLGIITAEIFRARSEVRFGFSLDELRHSISANDIAQAGNGLDMAQLMFAGVVCIGLFFVLFFYLLGALYDDRRDRSVLFWKSLPVGDAETVISKVLTAMLVAPLIALVVSTIAYVAFLAIVGVWLALHGLNPLPAIWASHPVGMFGRLLLTVPLSALWALPTIGWLLVWSAYARSKPFLWAVLIPVLAVFINGWLGVIALPHGEHWTTLKTIVGRLLFSVFPGSWMSSGATHFTTARIRFGIDDEHVLHSLDPSNLYTLLATPDLWIGVVTGLALTAAAIWFRGRRIETSV
jgi:ABC-2 type transport system permease protein